MSEGTRQERRSRLGVWVMIGVFALASAACTPKDGGEGTTSGESKDLIQVPEGLTMPPIPADNPVTQEKIDLGKALYFDTRLSKDGTVSCATCHDPKAGWTERRVTSEGIAGQVGDRNSPSVINSAYFPKLFWDGRSPSLEDQALGPIANPIEMGHTLEAMVADLGKIDGYKPLFKAAFGDETITKERVAQAIATFERTVLSGGSPYDKFQAGDKTALSEEQQRGLKLFDSHCATCHAPPLFTNHGYYNAGVGMDKEKIDEGLKNETKDEKDLGKFRVPALREVANTGPYFHDGSATTLAEAVALMAAGGKDNPNLSKMLKTLADEEISDQDQADLVAFLEALSGTYPIVEAPELP